MYFQSRIYVHACQNKCFVCLKGTIPGTSKETVRWKPADDLTLILSVQQVSNKAFRHVQTLFIQGVWFYSSRLTIGWRNSANQ